jgi:hypothetical protein
MLRRRRRLLIILASVLVAAPIASRGAAPGIRGLAGFAGAMGS